MPYWDYKCPTCGHVRTRRFTTVDEADSTVVHCDTEVCEQAHMERLHGFPNFAIKGYSAKNGYAEEGK